MHFQKKDLVTGRTIVPTQTDPENRFLSGPGLRLMKQRAVSGSVVTAVVSAIVRNAVPLDVAFVT